MDARPFSKVHLLLPLAAIMEQVSLTVQALIDRV
jgi:hypothetical protein